MKTIIPLAILFLLIAPMALAETNQRLELLSPVTGDTINPMVLGFQYRVASVTPIETCDLIIDGQVKKTTPYHDDINGKILSFFLPLDDGTYNWTVSCVTRDDVVLSDATRSVSTSTVTSEVTKKSSGLFRGSMAYEFNFENTIEQTPIAVNKLAAGDFLWIKLKVVPSTFKKELYVKRFESVDGKKFILLEDLKGRDEYRIAQGENVSINISSTTILINFVGIELNRANVLVYPSVVGTSTPAVQPDEPSKEDSSTGTGVEEGAGKDDATEGAGTDTSAGPTGPSTPAAPADDAAKPGVFKRFVSWLTSVFGA
jgi:hypothetical protein